MIAAARLARRAALLAAVFVLTAGDAYLGCPGGAPLGGGGYVCAASGPPPAPCTQNLVFDFSQACDLVAGAP
jgi:hypothetical protein